MRGGGLQCLISSESDWVDYSWSRKEKRRNNHLFAQGKLTEKDIICIAKGYAQVD